MKQYNKMITIIILLLLSNFLNAQNLSKTKSPDEIKDGTVYPTDPQWDPSWDWTANDIYIFYLQGGGVYDDQMRLPYYANSGAGDDFHTGPESYSEQRDIYSQDGWVCLFKDFGTPQRGTDFPKIILYNKYRGIMRFFFWLEDLNDDYDYSIVKLRKQHVSDKFALFTFTDNEKPFLDNYSADRTETAVGKLKEQTWNYVDFPIVGYDPNLPDDAKFYFEIFGVKEAQVKGNLIGKVDQILDKSGLHTSQDNSLFGGALKVASEAYSTYKTFKTYEKERQNIITNTTTGSWKDYWFAAPLHELATSSVFAEFIPGLLPFVSFLDAIIGGGKSKQTQPLHFKLDAELTGTLTFNPPIKDFMLRVPGAKHLGNDNLPFYDVPLGLFALKSQPSYTVYTRWLPRPPVNGYEDYYDTYNYISNLGLDYVYNEHVFSNITIENSYLVDNEALYQPRGYFYDDSNLLFAPTKMGSYAVDITDKNYTFVDHFSSIEPNDIYTYDDHNHKNGLRITLQPINPNHTATTLIKSYTPNYNIVNTNAHDPYFRFGGPAISNLPYDGFGTTKIDDNSIPVQGTNGRDIAYKLTLEETKVLRVSLCGPRTNFDTKLEIFDEFGFSTGYYNDDNDVACEEANDLTSTLDNISLNAGTYYVVIDGYGGDEGIYELHIEEDGGPTPNYTIPGLPYSHIYNNTSSGNNWDVMGSDGNDVSYKLYLSNPATLDISLCSSETDFDTKLEIFNADGTSAGYFNDDDYNCSANDTASSLNNLSLSSGTYFIVVDGHNGDTGNYELSVSYSYDYIIDDFDGIFNHNGSNSTNNDNWNVQGSDGKDVTYKLVLDGSTTISLSTCSENTIFDTKLEIFNANGTTTGYYNDDYEDCDCDYDVDQAAICNVTLSGGTYYVVVDGFAGDTGSYELSITAEMQKQATIKDSSKNSNLLVETSKIVSNFEYEADKANKKLSSKSRKFFEPNSPKNNITRQIDAYIVDMEKDLNDGRPLAAKYFNLSPLVDKKKVEEYEKSKKQKRDKKDGLVLNPPYPAPGNPSTTISYYLPQNAEVTIKIFNSLGEVVKTLVNKKLSTGNHIVHWNGKNRLGQQVASGVYIVSLSALNKNLSQKIIMLK